MYYVWRIAATCLTPAAHRLRMQKRCLLRMQICISKANVIACFSSTRENTTAFYFLPMLCNKMGALRYPSVSKTVVCTRRHCFRSCCIFALLPKGCQTVCCRLHHPLKAEKPSPRSSFSFFFSFSRPYRCCCVCTDITLVCMYLLPLFRSIAITEPRW